MITVVLIGSGNVAHHLITAFSKSKEINILQVYSRQKQTLDSLFDCNKIIANINNLVEADLYIIAVSDDAIATISSQLTFKDRLVVHTSGGVSIDSLDNKNRKGVFYPLQTFSKNATLDYNSIPMCLEATNETDYKLLEKVAKVISDKTFKTNSEQRKSLHVSAVFVNNFVNHLYQIGNEICEENNISFEILKPLIIETANKINTISIKEAQTGPAKRNDTTTIESHLKFLSNENHKKIYKTLTQSIQNNGK